MPPKPLSAILIICQTVLHELEGIVSAIRIGDLFFVPDLPHVLPENKIAMMSVLVMCKFNHDDESKRVFGFRLKRPDGTEKDVEFDFGRPLEISLGEIKPKVEGSPRGLNLIAPWGVKATHMGLHELILLIDGEVAASSFFTLASQQVSGAA